MPPETTPMMQQYLRMKELHPDCILFFRLGDFYEMFNEDAKLVSKELELTLTGKECGLEERAPMCGIPYHASEATSPGSSPRATRWPSASRPRTRPWPRGWWTGTSSASSPGTVISASMLEEGKNNFLSAIYADEAGVGLCLCDISTGEVFATSFSAGPEALDHLENELGCFHPTEAVLSQGRLGAGRPYRLLKDRLSCMCQHWEEASPWRTPGSW